MYVSCSIVCELSIRKRRNRTQKKKIIPGREDKGLRMGRALSLLRLRRTGFEWLVGRHGLEHMESGTLIRTLRTLASEVPARSLSLICSQAAIYS